MSPRRVIAFAALSTGFGLGLLHCWPPSFTATIDSGEVRAWGGHAFAIDLGDRIPAAAKGLFDVSPDAPNQPNRSSLKLLEDGRSIGTAHSIHADIAKLGGGRYSHWNRELVFSTRDGTDPRSNGRSYAIQYPLSPAPILPLALIVLGLLAAKTPARNARESRPDLSPKSKGMLSRILEAGPLAFWVGIAIVFVFANAVFIDLLPAPAVYPDSHGYLTWSLFRTVGYPALLTAFETLVGRWDLLPVFQLNLLLVSVTVLAVAVATVTRSRVAGWMIFACVISAGSMLVFAADLLTEAVFCAFVMLHLAAFIFFLEKRSPRFAAAAGIFLVAAVLTKSIAIVLVGPLLLFVATGACQRRMASLAILAPALVCWIAPSLHNGIRHGFFESTIIGGYALAGHVAWSIQPGEGSADPGESGRIASRLHPELLKRPPKWASIDSYVDYTANEYNRLLWANIVPELWESMGNACTQEKRGKCTWSSCPYDCEVVINRKLMRVAREAIAHDPLAYGRHVAAHYYGLWRDAFSASFNFVPAVRARADDLSDSFDERKSGFLKRMGPLPPFPGKEATLAKEAAIEESGWRRLVDLIALRQPLEWLAGQISRYAAIMLAASLIASAMILRPRQRSVSALACCYSALLANAYFLGTALAQPSLHRYAWAMQGVLAASVVLGAHCALTWISQHRQVSRTGGAFGFRDKDNS